MDRQTQLLLEKFREVYAGRTNQEQFTQWIKTQHATIWKNEEPILALDIALDSMQSETPDKIKQFRFLNVLCARIIASNLALANTAYSASNASKSDLAGALSFMVEALEALLKIKGRANNVMMYYRNIQFIYEQNIQKKDLIHYENMFVSLVNFTLNLKTYDSNPTFIFECTFRLVHIMYELKRILNDDKLFQDVAVAIEDIVLPNLDPVQHNKIVNKLNIIL